MLDSDCRPCAVCGEPILDANGPYNITEDAQLDEITAIPCGHKLRATAQLKLDHEHEHWFAVRAWDPPSTWERVALDK